MVDPSHPARDLPGRSALASRDSHAKPAWKSTDELSRVPEPPWKRSKQRQAFAGDVAAVELRTRLALAPDRLPEPPPPVAPPRKFASARRPFVGVVVVAAVGFIGYWWGAAPPASTRQLPSNRADLAPERSASAYLGSRGLDSKSPAVRPPPPNATPLVYPPDQSASLGSPAPDRPFAAAHAGTGDVAARPPREAVESAAALTQESTPAILRENRERALRLKQRGDDQLALGLVAPARLLYERAADLGLAQAALALAATYDETAPPHSNLRGIGSDPKAAAYWYERARVLAARDPDPHGQTLGRN